VALHLVNKLLTDFRPAPHQGIKARV